MEERGGDIDLYIETQMQDPQAIVDAKYRFLRELQKKIGLQKIDVVIKYETAEDLAIYNVAKKDGVLLV